MKLPKLKKPQLCLSLQHFYLHIVSLLQPLVLAVLSRFRKQHNWMNQAGGGKHEAGGEDHLEGGVEHPGGHQGQGVLQEQGNPRKEAVQGVQGAEVMLREAVADEAGGGGVQEGPGEHFEGNR